MKPVFKLFCFLKWGVTRREPMKLTFLVSVCRWRSDLESKNILSASLSQRCVHLLIWWLVMSAISRIIFMLLLLHPCLCPWPSSCLRLWSYPCLCSCSSSCPIAFFWLFDNAFKGNALNILKTFIFKNLTPSDFSEVNVLKVNISILKSNASNFQEVNAFKVNSLSMALVL